MSMKIKPGSIVKYRKYRRGAPRYCGLHIVVEVAGTKAKTYNIRTGSVTHMSIMFLRSEFLFL